MASDSQILALSTMFTEDVFAFYGGKSRFGETVQVATGRIFVIAVTVFAYAVAMRAPQAIFDIAVQFAFSGYAALSPLVFAALFWKNSTKWGALSAVLWVASSVVAVALFQSAIPAPPPGPPRVVWSAGGFDVLARTASGTAIFGFAPVVPMTLISALLIVAVSAVTPKPSAETVRRYEL
jgi:solute:Na+ symporter, SSS family